MLVKHVRDLSNRPYATIVAISPELIGVAVCRPNEAFNKKLGVTIAEGRARLGVSAHIPNRYVFADNMLMSQLLDNGATMNAAAIPELKNAIAMEVSHMRKRAKRYFKHG